MADNGTLSEALDNVDNEFANPFAPGKTLVNEDSNPPQTAAMIGFLKQRRIMMQGMIADCEKTIEMCDKALEL